MPLRKQPFERTRNCSPKRYGGQEVPAITTVAAGDKPKVAVHPLLTLQRRFGNRQVQQLIHAAGNEDAVSRVHSSSGRPLDKTTRIFMEERLGRDLGRVRVHTSDSAPMLQAAAYTRGNDIFFGPGKYRPDLHEGRALIAHELVHVLQHNNTSASGTDGLTSYSHPAEVEARLISRNVMEGGGPVRPQASLGSQAVSRQLDPHSVYCALHAAVCLGLSENPPAAALCWSNFALRCGGGQASADQSDSGQQLASASGSGTDAGGGAQVMEEST